MVSGPPRCKRMNGAQNACRFAAELFLPADFSSNSDPPNDLARMPNATAATQSADKYAHQTRMLMNLLVVTFRLEPKTMSISCKNRLIKVSAWICHRVQILITFSKDVGMAPFFSTREIKSKF